MASVSRLCATFLCNAVARRFCSTLLLLFCLASSARWEWHGRLVVEPDSALTLVRMAIDTAHGGHDVGLARYDFNPAVGEGDEYSLTLALDLENVRDLRQSVPTCLCRPLKPDSVRGTFTLATRGLRQITGRVDATLYFTEWNDAARHVSYPLHQRIDLLK